MNLREDYDLLTVIIIRLGKKQKKDVDYLKGFLLVIAKENTKIFAYRMVRTISGGGEQNDRIGRYDL